MEQQFIKMINTHRGLLCKVCNLYCDDAEDRKDLFQEVLLQHSFGASMQRDLVRWSTCA